MQKEEGTREGACLALPDPNESDTQISQGAAMNGLEMDLLRGDETMKLSNSIRNMFFAFTACTIGLGLLAVSGHAQNTPSKQAQKEKIVTQTAAVPPKTDLNVDREAIRAFHIDIPQEALADLRRRIVAT